MKEQSEQAKVKREKMFLLLLWGEENSNRTNERLEYPSINNVDHPPISV